MPRRSLRSSGASEQASASGAQGLHKRTSSSAGGGTAQERKRRKNGNEGSSLKSTPNKSKYFKEDDDIDQTSDEDFSAEEDASAYEDTGASADASAAASESEDEEKSEEEVTPKKSTNRKKSTVNLAKETKGQELWRPGVKAGLGPGTELVIKRPKARPAGSTPYADDRIHPNTMLFLKDLAANNDRQWLKMHDPDYRTALKDWNTFVGCLTEKVIEADETVPELPVKDIVFRIYRDVRFSNDPTPYKTCFSAAWSRTGRKGPYAAYYAQIQPGGSFVGGGMWMPEAGHLAAIREDIDRRPDRIKQVLTDARIRKQFFGGISNDAKKAVKAFVAHNAETALKTKPKGYDADHKDIDLLRLKNFTIGKKLADEEVIGPGGLGRIAEVISCMVPFITYLNNVVMPDNEPAGPGDEEGNEDEEDEEDEEDKDEDEDEDGNSD